MNKYLAYSTLILLVIFLVNASAKGDFLTFWQY